jgi:diguanylate cyclase (GGDEF)-like protein
MNMTKSNEKLGKGLQQQIRELATLNEIGVAIASTVKLGELWKLIYHQICRVMKVSNFYIALYDHKKEELYNVIDMLNKKPRPQGRKYRKFGKGRTEYVIRNNKPLIIKENVAEAYKKLGILSRDSKAKSYVAVPISVGNNVIGALAVQNYKSKNAYDMHSVVILSFIANYTAVAIENARLYNESQRRLKEMITLQKIGMELTSSLDLTSVLQTIAESTLELVEGDYVHIFDFDSKTGKFSHRAAASPPQAGKHPITWPRKHGLSATVLKTKKPVIIENAATHPIFSTPQAKKWGVKSTAGFPLKGKLGITGVLNVAFRRPHIFSKEEINLISHLADQAAVAIENSRLYEETKQLATTDHLTKIWNRRYFDSYLRTELIKSRRLNKQLSVLMIDIDNFKSFNDTYGHSSGDKILLTTANIIVDSCRNIDVVGRYGGDEFAVILLETSNSNAEKVSKRILAALNNNSFLAPDGTRIPVTASIGIASYTPDCKDAEELLSLADSAMYKAKSAGGGRFSFFLKS